MMGGTTGFGARGDLAGAEVDAFDMLAPRDFFDATKEDAAVIGELLLGHGIGHDHEEPA